MGFIVSVRRCSILLGLLAYLAWGRPCQAALAPSPDLITVEHLTGPIYIIEDENIFSENSVFYIGPSSVTIIGTGWSPEIARLIDSKIKTITSKPISDVVDTDFNPERAGGNCYWQQIGAQVLSTRLTAELLRRNWASQSIETRSVFPNYPDVPLCLPTVVFSKDFELEGGRIMEFYIGPSHTVDDIFIYFPEQQVLYAGNF